MRYSTFSLGLFAAVALAVPATIACGDPGPAKNGSNDPWAALAKLAGRRDKPVASAAPTVETPAPSAPLSPVTMTPLRSPQALEHLFQGFAALEDGVATTDVRIMQFGDSHTAADIETGQVRRELQDRFGDGGRGFVALGQPYSGYYQEGIRVGASGFKGERGKYVKGKFVGDGAYGLSGYAVEAGHAGARAWTDVRNPTSRVEVDMLAQPGGGSFDLYIDGQKQARVKTASPDYGATYQPFDVPEGPHHIEARAVGDGEVRLFGMSLDRQNPGVTFDALGINGARVTNALQWNEGLLAEQVRHRDPSLVILAFGTNEAGDDTSPATYERQITDLVGRISRGAPQASCLLLGPVDRAAREAPGVDAWQTMPKLLEIVETQARVAESLGCAFYDQMSAMGGPGTIAQWANENPPRARKDRVHLSQDGYRQMGSLLAHDLLQAYEQWRGMPAGSPKTPNAPQNPPLQQLPTAPSSVPQPAQSSQLTPPVAQNPALLTPHPDSIARYASGSHPLPKSASLPGAPQ